MTEGSLREHDVVVVGAGSAGCVVVRRLVDAGLRVLLLEAGGSDDDPRIQEPARLFEVQRTEHDWCYTTVGQPAAGGRRLAYPRGKVLGGSSSLYAMIHARGHRNDYDTWAYVGNAGWGYDDVLPVFKRSEDFDGGESEYRGMGGPLNVLSRYEPHPVLASIVEAAQQAGIPRNEDYNGAELDGVSFIQLNIKDGRRHSSASAFLRPVWDAPNLTVRTGCQALRLLLEDGRCVGVAYARDGAVEEARAEHEVVVSAGAIDSPKLLLLSGIGPAGELARHGIDVTVELPGVGENLTDHLYAGLVHAAAKPVPPAVPGLQQAHAHSFLRTRPGLPGPDLQTLLVHLPVGPEDTAIEGDGFTLASMLVRTTSSGNLRLASADPADAPLIDPGFLRCEIDVETIAIGLERCREIAAQPALDEWRGEELYPGPDVRTRDELRDFVRRTAATIYHPVGTCKMGVDELAVVDPELRVYGVDGLRVADASVMPLITSANTHVPSVLIGERAAGFVLDSLRIAAPAEAVGAPA